MARPWSSIVRLVRHITSLQGVCAGLMAKRTLAASVQSLLCIFVCEESDATPHAAYYIVQVRRLLHTFLAQTPTERAKTVNMRRGIVQPQALESAMVMVVLHLAMAQVAARTHPALAA